MQVISNNLTDILKDGTVVPAHGPWPRIIVDSAAWQKATDALAACECDLLGLWAETECVHMALLGHDAAPEIAVVTIPCADRRYPSVGQFHPPAIRLERAARDLFGVMPVGLADTRPWLDHGLWALGTPLAQPPADASIQGYAFLPVEGDDLHEIPVGPVHAGIIEPGHFRFTADGETVVRLEQRLGYTHKGTEGLLQGSDIARAARLAGRISGDSTVAYGFAFARAVEAAANVPAPDRAIFLRAVMAELERLANHFGDFGAICNDASFVIMHANSAILRERVLRAANACFGHRLMMDCIVPGGIACDITPDGIAHLRALLGEIELRFPPLVQLYDRTTSLQDRTVTTGIVRPELIRQFAPGGYVGRAGGRTFDARRALAYPPYDQLHFEVPLLTESDVNARVWIRIREIEQSVALLRQLIDRLPGGPVQADADLSAAAAGREGMALIEGFRGDVLVWLRMDAAGRIARCHLRDPSWFQWPLLEAAIEGNIVADFPLCNKSFNCSYSGHDL